MIDRLMPIFAVIGLLSSLGYLGLMAWAMYGRLFPAKNKRIHH